MEAKVGDYRIYFIPMIQKAITINLEVGAGRTYNNRTVKASQWWTGHHLRMGSPGEVALV